MMSRIRFYQELEEEQVGEGFMEENDFTWGKKKNWRKNAIGILESGCYIQIWHCLRKIY